MSIVNSVATAFIDSGELYQNTGVSLSGTTTTAVPASSGSFLPTISRGIAHCRHYTGGGTSPTISDITVTGTDGTKTTNLGWYHPATAIAMTTGILVELRWDFITDLLLTSISFAVTMTGTSATCSGDYEVVGTP
jgi:hypothetical protein